MSTLRVPNPSMAGTSVRIGSAPARAKMIATTAANPACTIPASCGAPFGRVRARACGRIFARPSEYRYRVAELWNASMAANRLTSSRIIITVVSGPPRYCCEMEKIRSPVGRCSSAVAWACATPVALTTAHVVTPRMTPIAMIEV